jgi:hypothetical protein
MHAPCDPMRCIFQLELSSGDTARLRTAVLEAAATASYDE